MPCGNRLAAPTLPISRRRGACGSSATARLTVGIPAFPFVRVASRAPAARLSSAVLRHSHRYRGSPDEPRLRAWGSTPRRLVPGHRLPSGVRRQCWTSSALCLWEREMVTGVLPGATLVRPCTLEGRGRPALRTHQGGGPASSPSTGCTRNTDRGPATPRRPPGLICRVSGPYDAANREADYHSSTRPRPSGPNWAIPTRPPTPLAERVRARAESTTSWRRSRA